MPTQFLNRIPTVVGPTVLLADVFGASEAGFTELSFADLRDLLR